jgi:beta-glucosidase
MQSFLPDLSTLSLAQKVAQLVVVRASGYLFDHEIRYPKWEAPTDTLVHWLTDLGVGGVIVLGGSAAEIALRTQQLQRWAKYPLLIAADIEEGVGQRFSGATWFPPPMALGEVAHYDLAQAKHYAQQMGMFTAQEAAAIGLNWLLTPVVDVNNNPDNPVINIRAFGETSTVVSHLTSAFIAGTKPYPVLTTAKHFPGHGDTAVDSHLELPILPHSLERLAAVELPPFQAAIAAGVDTVMTAHLLIPSLDSARPATLSRRILTQELRQNLAFNGVIVTDALVMDAITQCYGANEAAVMAIEAGADVLMMPVDAAEAIQAVCAAVAEDRITEDQIEASVERVWRAKQKVLTPSVTAHDLPHAWEQVSSPQIDLDRLAQPVSLQLVQQILQNSQRVHVPQRLNPTLEGNWCNLIVVDNLLDIKYLGRHTPAIAHLQALGFSLRMIDSHSPQIPSNQAPLHPQPTLLQLFMRGNPFRGSAGMSQLAEAWFHYLLKTEQLRALAIYGSPYILEKFQLHLPQAIPYVFTYGQTIPAQAEVLKHLIGDEQR